MLRENSKRMSCSALALDNLYLPGLEPSGFRVYKLKGQGQWGAWGLTSKRA